MFQIKCNYLSYSWTGFIQNYLQYIFFKSNPFSICCNNIIRLSDLDNK